MALTQNEQLIIKYVAENFVTKKNMENIVPAYAVGSTPYASDWLAKSIDGDPFIPIEGRFYFVANVGNMYQWSRTEHQYVQANLPDRITADEVTAMW